MAYTGYQEFYGPGAQASADRYAAGVMSGPGANAFGTKPVLPAPASTAPAATGGAMALGNQVYNQLPGYQQSLANVGGNIASETAGQLPPDVIRQMQQQAAERGIATGTGGSDNNNAAYLRALGLNSLSLTNMGQQNLSSILPGLPGAQISQNPNFYPTTGQAGEVGQANAVYQSAPDPHAAAAAAMAAAAGGVAAGRGFAGGGGMPSGPASDFWNPGTTTPGQVYGGSGVDNSQVLNTANMDQGAIDKILHQYDPNQANTEHAWGDPNFGSYVAQGAATGTGAGSFDFGGGDLYNFD